MKRSMFWILAIVLTVSLLFANSFGAQVYAETYECEHSYDNDCDVDCNVCGATRTTTHTYISDCDSICDVCGQTRIPTVAHTTVNYTFTNSASYPFSLSNGVYTSTNKAHSSSATAVLNVLYSGTIQIQYSTSTEPSYDKLYIKHNSSQIVSASGETSWTTATISVVAGDTISFTYSKDNSAYKGNDAVSFKIISPDSEPTCTSPVICKLCEEVAIAALGHTYSNNCDTDCNTCGETRTVGDHKYNNACDKTCNYCGETRTVGAHEYTNACDTDCNICGFTRTITHTYTNSCDTACDVCGATRTVTHTYSNACDKTCDVCGATRTVGAHKYSNACDKTCNDCGKTRTVGAHEYTNACDKTCNICDATRTVGSHQYTNKCDKTCNICGKTRTITHTYSNACDKSCNVCKATRTVTHTYTANCDKTCNVCGAKRTAPSAHTTTVYSFENDSYYPFSLSNGVYSSTNSAGNSSSTATLNITSSGTVKIQYSTSTERNYDKLTIRHNSTDVVVASGETSWTTVTISVAAGDTISITYKKDYSYSSGYDTVYFKLPAAKGQPTCTSAVVCQVCNEVSDAALGHTYSNKCDKTCNTCGASRTVGAHKYSNACDKTCNYCGKTRTVSAHKYTNKCDKTCNICGKTRTIKHTYSNNCDKSCNVCKATRTVGAHKYSNKCDKTCNYCGKTRTVGSHKYSSKCDESCNYCGKTRTVKHSYKTTTTKATLKKDGSVVKKCTVCKKVASKQTVKYVKTVKLSADTYTYNGKAKTPKLVVKDSAGKTLKLKTDYTVTYASGRTKVGTYKVTVKLIGKYSGTKTLTFKVLPTAKTSVTGFIGDVIKIGAKSNTTIKYTSSNKKIATVNSKGEITAVGAGTATVTVKSGKVTQKITVKVTKPTVSISAPQSSMYIGKTMKLTAAKNTSGGKITWSVNNKKLATISSKGVLKALAKGTVTVKATLTYKGKTYTKAYKVSISVEYPDVSIFISSKIDYSSSYGFIVTNNGDSPLKVLARGYAYCDGDSEDIDSLYIGDGKFYEWVSIKAGKSVSMAAALENKMVFLKSKPTYFYVYLEYNGELFKASCSTNEYGIDKCHTLTWYYD